MKILIADTIHESIFSKLKKLNFEIDYIPKISRQEIISTIHSYDALLIRSKTKVDAELLGKNCKLQFVARPGAGLDLLDIAELRGRNIEILNSPEGNRDALGEHALGLLLSLSNNIVKGDKEVRNGVWDREGNRGFEIKGKTVGLVGYGHMGSAFAEKLSGLSCHVIAYDNKKTGFSSSYVTEVSQQELFDQSDIVSFHIPLDKDNLDLVDAKYLNSFRKKIVLLNTSRGKILVLKDLINLLESGKVSLAALDVIENERLDQLTESEEENFNKLISNNRVILTPHVGGWSFESYKKMNDVLIEKIEQLLIK